MIIAVDAFIRINPQENNSLVIVRTKPCHKKWHALVLLFHSFNGQMKRFPYGYGSNGSLSGVIYLEVLCSSPKHTCGLRAIACIMGLPWPYFVGSEVPRHRKEKSLDAEASILMVPQFDLSPYLFAVMLLFHFRITNQRTILLL